jgi:hypothetical protein
MKTLTAALLLMFALAAPAAAQSPYDGPPSYPTWCAPENPYNLPAGCPPISVVAERASTIVAIPEGVVHAPGSELAYAVITGLSAGYQNVVVQFIAEGRAPVTRYLMVGPNSRTSIEAHAAYEGLTTFSTVVYCERACAASLVMRPAGPNFWSSPTIVAAQVVK